VREAAQRTAALYDNGGDAHYDAISAYIKSLRGSDPDGALYWLARMLEGGEDPEFIARRVVIFASEDVGLADPLAIVRATAAAAAVRMVGLPEAALNLSQVTIDLSLAPPRRSPFISGTRRLSS
jgi:putative ATPase